MTTPHALPVTNTLRRRGLIILAVVLLGISVTASAIANTTTAHAAAPPHGGGMTRPHVLTTELAAVLVHVGGGANCTGTPITGTDFVVTAAHCVLDHNGHVARRTVQRNGTDYTPVSVLVNTAYHHSPGPRLDAAILIMDHQIPGPSATLGATLPTAGSVTLAGFQPLDTDGSLLRGTRYDNRPLPTGATGPVVTIHTGPAGCTQPASNLTITPSQVKMPCGLIPGASGGGLYTTQNHKATLIGIISTVAPDLTYNGIVPMQALHELLDNPTTYTHTLPPVATTHGGENVVRS